MDGDLYKTPQTETQGVSRRIPRSLHFHQQGIYFLNSFTLNYAARIFRCIRSEIAISQSRLATYLYAQSGEALRRVRETVGV